MKVRMGIVFTAITCLVLTCCRVNTVPTDCARYFPATLKQVPFATLQPTTASDWIAKTFAISETNIEKSDRDDSVVGFGWSKGSNGYGIRFHPDGRKKLTITWKNAWDRPTIQDTLRCLGNPDMYSAELGQVGGGLGLSMSLWYLTDGIIADATTPGMEAPKKPEALPLLSMAVVPTGTISDVVNNLYYVVDAQVAQSTIQNLRPWPGDIKQIVIDQNQ